jgi:hypothetical protein
MELRPLGFGEIFDRAVTLYLRNFVPFVAIVMVLVLPLSILQYVIDRASQPQLAAMLWVFQHPGRVPPGHLPTIFDSRSAVTAIVASLVLTYALWPFALNAVAVGVARLYGDRPVEFRACYEVVLRRWVQIVALLGLEVLIFLGWYLAVLLVAVAVVFMTAFLGALFAGAAFVIGVIIGLGAFIVMVPLLAPLLVAMTFAMYAAVIEERSTMESLSLGFSRIFNRAEFWRAMLFSVAAVAVIIGASSMFGIVGLLADFAHLPGVAAIVEAIPRAAIEPFGVVLWAIYYFDVRIRHEGFDLEASLLRLSGVASA